MRIDVALKERVLVHVDETPALYLGPGRHRIYRPFQRIDLVRLNTENLLADLRPEQLALVPAEDLRLVTVLPHERAVLVRRGKPVKWLGAGEHQVWTTERSREGRAAVSVEMLDLSGVSTTPLRDDLKAIVPSSDYVETTAPAGSVALRYVDGVLDSVLPPGRHAAWNVVRKVSFAVIDLREKLLHVTAQEVMTKDRVTLRLNVSASYRVDDAARLATVARAPDEVLYLALQLAAREAVAGHTLDELLVTREALAAHIAPEVQAKAAAVGLEVLSLGVKDVVLPGEMKALLNRVIEAQKEAEANVILRREETAATRSMAQTAKVLAENPLLVRLKELEAYKELAAKVGQVHVVLGDGAMPKLELKA